MVPALISAAVAITVLIISQWVIFWRERSRLLLGKLEDLYMFLLDLGSRNRQGVDVLTNFFSSGFGGGEGEISHLVMAKAGEETKSSFDQIGDLLLKIRLLVDFYFPQLRPDLEAMKEAYLEAYLKARHLLADRIGQTNPTREEVIESWKAFDHLRGAMLQGIRKERPVLIKAFAAEFRVRFGRKA